MDLHKIAHHAGIAALLWLSQMPLQGQSESPAVVSGAPSPTIILETIDLKADAGLEDVHPDHLTRSLTGRHWDDDDWVEELKQRVVVAWQQLGYYKAEADVDAHRVRKSPQEKAYVVTVNVHAGRQYRLGEIHFDHAKQFTSAELRSLFLLEAGDIFNVHKIWDGFDALRKAYGSRGLIKFVAVPDTKIDEPHDRISITVDVDEGPQFRISEIKVLGLDSELAKKLVQDLGLRQGDIYRPPAVDDCFQKNRNALPPGAKAEDQTLLKIDEQSRTISLIFDFGECNPKCD